MYGLDGAYCINRFLLNVQLILKRQIVFIINFQTCNIIFNIS